MSYKISIKSYFSRTFGCIGSHLEVFSLSTLQIHKLRLSPSVVFAEHIINAIFGNDVGCLSCLKQVPRDYSIRSVSINVSALSFSQQTYYATKLLQSLPYKYSIKELRCSHGCVRHLWSFSSFVQRILRIANSMTQMERNVFEIPYISRTFWSFLIPDCYMLIADHRYGNCIVHASVETSMHLFITSLCMGCMWYLPTSSLFYLLFESCLELCDQFLQ